MCLTLPGQQPVKHGTRHACDRQPCQAAFALLQTARPHSLPLVRGSNHKHRHQRPAYVIYHTWAREWRSTLPSIVSRYLMKYVCPASFTRSTCGTNSSTAVQQAVQTTAMEAVPDAVQTQGTGWKARKATQCACRDWLVSSGKERSHINAGIHTMPCGRDMRTYRGSCVGVPTFAACMLGGAPKQFQTFCN